MDIDFLLWLQNLRNAVNSPELDRFMQLVSDFGVSYSIFIFAFVYWCISKRGGLYIIASYTFGRMLNGLIKLIACVYRPWIRDARIIPAGNAIETATGYSFPSGHTLIATIILGGNGALLRKAGYKLLSLLFFALVLLVGFSRNYLGVHTPQDVVVGLLVGMFTLWALSKVFNYVDNHRSSENLFLILAFVICAAIFVYVNNKNFPMDYDANNKLIVDPAKMLRDIWKAAGLVIGFILGRFIEKYFIKFKPSGFKIVSIILAVIGIVIYGYINMVFQKIATGQFGHYYGRMLSGFTGMFFVMAVWPAVIKIFQGNK